MTGGSSRWRVNVPPVDADCPFVSTDAGTVEDLFEKRGMRVYGF